MRVIAGTRGGRRLSAPRGRATRPTSDRVREALFMSLEPLAGLNVVDLFAGSGALGIEALSRGAARVDFVEPDRAARLALGENLESLELVDLARVWPLTLPAALRRIGAALAGADLIFMDPPYGGGPARATLAALAASGALKPRARVVVEHHVKDALPDSAGRLERVRVQRYGETVVSTYRAPVPGPTSHGEEEQHEQ